MGSATSLTEAKLIELLANSVNGVKVSSGAEARPAVTGVVFWIGGSVKPSAMLSTDVWLKEISSTPSAPQFLTTSLNTLTLNVPFSQAMLMDGTTPMTFTIVSGAFPAGLTMHSTTGVVSGTPTASGTFNVLVRATNAQGNTTQQFSGTVNAGVIAPDILSTSLNSLTQGSPFSQTLSVTGTSPTWTISAGNLPSGLTLNSSTGAITGTPTGSGAYSFSVQATNSAGTDTQAFSGTITSTGTAPSITTTVFNAMQAGVAFAQTIARVGSSPMTWGVSAGALPNGMTVNSSTGVLSGTPAAAGAYSFTVQATNSFGSDTQAYTGSVAASASVFDYSIFGATAPSSLTSYSDSPTGAWLSHQFYKTGVAFPADTKIIGARLFVPAGSAHIGKTWKGALIRRVGALFTSSFNELEFGTNGSAKVGGPLTEGWNTVLFDTEYDKVDPGGAWQIGVQIGTGVDYLYNSTLDVGAIPNPDGKGFYLAGAEEASQRCWFNGNKAATAARWYGIDTLIRIPA